MSDVPVIVIWGQSNAAGDAVTGQLTTAIGNTRYGLGLDQVAGNEDDWTFTNTVTFPKVEIWASDGVGTGTGDFEVLTFDGSGGGSTGNNLGNGGDVDKSGIELQLAYRIQNDPTNFPDGAKVIKYAVGSTSLALQPDDVDSWNVDAEERMRYFRDDYLVPAINDILDAGNTPVLQPVIFAQGETDAVAFIATSNPLPFNAPIQYKKNFYNCFKYLRDLVQADFPVAVIGMKDSMQNTSDRSGMKSYLIANTHKDCSNIIGNATWVDGYATGESQAGAASGVDATHWSPVDFTNIADTYYDNVLISGDFIPQPVSGFNFIPTDVPTIEFTEVPDDIYPKGSTVRVSAKVTSADVNIGRITYYDGFGNVLGGGSSANLVFQNEGYNQIIARVETGEGLRGEAYTGTHIDGLDASIISGAEPNLRLKQGVGQNRLTAEALATGTHDGASGSAYLEDSALNYKDNVAVSMYVKNVTDGSWSWIQSNTSDTFAAPLRGGTNNYWSSGDSYEIHRFWNVWENQSATGSTYDMTSSGSEDIEDYLGAFSGSLSDSAIEASTSPVAGVTEGITYVVLMESIPSYKAASGKNVIIRDDENALEMEGNFRTTDGTTRILSGRNGDANQYIDVEGSTMMAVASRMSYESPTGATDGRIYIIRDGEVALGETIYNWVDPAGDFAIGGTNSGSSNGETVIKEVAIFDYAVPVEELQALTASWMASASNGEVSSQSMKLLRRASQPSLNPNFKTRGASLGGRSSGGGKHRSPFVRVK